MPHLVNNPAYSNNAQIELTRESALLEERLKPITAEMNRRFLRVSEITWIKNLESAEEIAHFHIDWCRHLAGDDSFRPNSAADCARALSANGCDLQLNKKSGKPATDKDTLSELANSGVTLAGAILDARSAISRWSQLRAWEPYAKYGRVQPIWDSCGCPHGRYTSDGPCLTNRIVPIRETIESEPGFSFLSLDLSQAEYVVWASLSGDPVLGAAFKAGRDFHIEMAQAIKEEVPTWDLRGQCLRDAGKTVNFSILYQMKPHTLARKLGCSVEIASRIITAYYDKTPAAAFFITVLLTNAELKGFVETHYGRRRYCPELLLATKERDVHEIEKTLWNHVNAGTAAEFLKWKQVKIWNALRTCGFDEGQVWLTLNMFDELVFQIRDDVFEEVREVAETVMREPVKGFLPFGVGVKEGKTWGEVSK